MSFDSYAAEKKEGEGKKFDVDFDALNDYVIKTAECEQPETMNGYVSVIVDLGTQKQPDAEYDLDKEDAGKTAEELTEKYAKEISDGSITKFDLSYDSQTKQKVLRKFVPQKDRQSIAYAVDFPVIQLDKGQLFGDDSGTTNNLRLWAGGVYYHPVLKKQIVQNLIPLRITKDEKMGWTMKTNSVPHKLAVAGKLVRTDEAFMPERIDELLGVQAQWSGQIFNRVGTGVHAGKKFYTEKMKFVGAVQKGTAPFENMKTYLIQFNKENDPEALKQLRPHIINTIMQATNYEGSVIQKNLEEHRPHSVGKKVEAQPQAQSTPAKQQQVAQPDLDDDLPF